MGTSSARDLVNDPVQSNRPFLSSVRAQAACTRELGRLGDEVERGIEALDGPIHDEKVTVRRSPDRYIIQVGPVALTFAWLRGHQESVASGELLVIGWRGEVAPRKNHSPERPIKGPASLGATALWEEVLTPIGESEQTLGWHSPADDIGRCSSIELAARCVSRLQAAYLAGDVEGGKPLVT